MHAGESLAADAQVVRQLATAMKTAFLVLGWTSIAVAVFFALAMHRADRRMQAFRAPDARASAFVLIPLRWKSELYTAEGQEWVGKAWRFMFLMYGTALLGMVLLSQGVAALP
jgi:hypothetical protein